MPSKQILSLQPRCSSKLLFAFDVRYTNFAVREFFKSSCIFVSDSEDVVRDFSDCVWRGPVNMRTKPALQPLYKRTVGDRRLPLIEQLFHQTLEIPSASLDDIIEELTAIREDGEGTENIIELYKYLDKSRYSVANMRYVSSPVLFLPIPPPNIPVALRLEATPSSW